MIEASASRKTPPTVNAKIIIATGPPTKTMASHFVIMAGIGKRVLSLTHKAAKGCRMAAVRKIATVDIRGANDPFRAYQRPDPTEFR